jgi:hemoglobin
VTSSLYERLGGAIGLSAIVKDTLDNHLNNPLVKTRYQGADHDKLHRLSVEFFGMGSGGPEQYTGRDMLETHRGMNISEQEFIAVIDDILEALDKNDIDNETRTEVLGILYSLKGDIVRV